MGHGYALLALYLLPLLLNPLPLNASAKELGLCVRGVYERYITPGAITIS